VPELAPGFFANLSRTSPQTITELWQQGRERLRGFRVLRLGINPGREVLYERINRRAAKMLDDGLIAETERLLAKYGPEARPLGRWDTSKRSSICAAKRIGRRRWRQHSRHTGIMPSGR